MRNTYLFCYDISSDKRRTKVFEKLEGYGDHLQYSVFICDLTPRERARLETDLHKLVNHQDDQILVVNLGTSEKGGVSSMKYIGLPFSRSQITCTVL